MNVDLSIEGQEGQDLNLMDEGKNLQVEVEAQTGYF